ncbi:MAG: hypothetical protein HQK49_10815 [Oligoflexia bacterium]|nr:hypothetical protein [Oligoflexia bacterium]
MVEGCELLHKKLQAIAILKKIVLFEEMKVRSLNDRGGCSTKSSIYQATNYFLENSVTDKDKVQ